MTTSNGQDDIIPYENEFGLWVPLDKFNALQKENIRLRQLFELEHENHMSMVRDRDLKWQMADDNYAKAKSLEQTVDSLNEENARMARRIAELEGYINSASSSFRASLRTAFNEIEKDVNMPVD